MFSGGDDVESENLSNRRPLCVAGLPLTQSRLVSVEVHNKVLNGSDVVDCTLQSVRLILKHHRLRVAKFIFDAEGHMIWRLCGSKQGEKQSKQQLKML